MNPINLAVFISIFFSKSLSGLDNSASEHDIFIITEKIL